MPARRRGRDLKGRRLGSLRLVTLAGGITANRRGSESAAWIDAPAVQWSKAGRSTARIVCERGPEELGANAAKRGWRALRTIAQFAVHRRLDILSALISTGFAAENTHECSGSIDRDLLGVRARVDGAPRVRLAKRRRVGGAVAELRARAETARIESREHASRAVGDDAGLEDSNSDAHAGDSIANFDDAAEDRRRSGGSAHGCASGAG